MIKTILKINKLFNSVGVSAAPKKRPKDFEFFQNFLKLARSQMNKHGLIDWSLDLDYAKVRAGACFFNQKKISFSRNFVKKSSHEDINDTILHEIAHALVGPKHGHNKVWKEMALKLGCSAQRCHTLEFSEYKWVRSCVNECWQQKVHRRRSNLICKKCGSKVIYKKNN